MPLPVVTAAVEGITDEALIKRVCAYAGAPVGRVFGRNGKRYVLDRISGYNNSARFRHWIVVVDLDEDHQCAGPACKCWLPAPAALMCFRLAVRAAEAWMLADRERFASFFAVPIGDVPENPDFIPDPKQFLVTLSAKSRRRAIREDMVPRLGTGQKVGPAYASRLIEFVSKSQGGWRPESAETVSESFRRCVAALRALLQRPFPAAEEASSR